MYQVVLEKNKRVALFSLLVFRHPLLILVFYATSNKLMKKDHLATIT